MVKFPLIKNRRALDRYFILRTRLMSKLFSGDSFLFFFLLSIELNAWPTFFFGLLLIYDLPLRIRCPSATFVLSLFLFFFFLTEHSIHLWTKMVKKKKTLCFFKIFNNCFTDFNNKYFFPKKNEFFDFKQFFSILIKIYYIIKKKK